MDDFSEGLNPSLQQLNWQNILYLLYYSIYIVDKNGVVSWVNKASKRISNIEKTTIIGRCVDDLESSGVFFPSVARKILHNKKEYTCIQTLANGKQVVATGMPLLDLEGNLKWVVVITSDINEIIDNIQDSYGKSCFVEALNRKVEDIEKQSEVYSAELMALREKQLETPGIIARSKIMSDVLQLTKKVANVNTSILLLGHSGVGKSLIAKTIHTLSSRHNGPFIEVSCAAIPENLLESELFGYEPGAFTGASRKTKIGMVELAEKGTLFLDEVGELPPALQAKLLYVLQERKVKRLGSKTAIPVDIRIIAATNRCLNEMTKQGTFREDLYYRLSVVPITIPTLIDRREDIPPLVIYFLNKFCKHYGISKHVAPHTMDLIVSYSWPGNVRELENLIERLVVTSEHKVIRPADLPKEFFNTAYLVDDNSPLNDMITLKEALENTEKKLFEAACAKYSTTREIAKALDINQSTVVRKIRKHFGFSNRA